MDEALDDIRQEVLDEIYFDKLDEAEANDDEAV